LGGRGGYGSSAAAAAAAAAASASASAAAAAAQRQADEDAYWGEEAGRRFAAQQEELVALRERVAAQQAELDAAGGRGAGVAANASAPAASAARYEARISELTRTLRAYEQRLSAGGGNAARPASAASGGGGGGTATACAVHGDTSAVIDALRREVGRYQVGDSVCGGSVWLSYCAYEAACCMNAAALLWITLQRNQHPPLRYTAVTVYDPRPPNPQARVQELEADFVSLNALAASDLTGVDAEVRKAWLTAAAFKKRCGG